MSTLAQTDDRLQIGKLSLVYSVCGNQGATESARQRLDRLLENALRQHLTGVFEPLRAAGDGLWFIRRLELVADIDLELSDHDIMSNWSRQLARTLQRYMLDERSDEVIYFEDYPQYLGRFITDLAKGSAWQAWYYQNFAGLRALPANMAIATALLQQPALGVQALAGLPRADRARVLNALTAQGAQRLLTGFADVQASQPCPLAALLRAVFSEFEQQPGIPLLVTDHPWLETLELYLRVVTRQPHYAGQPLVELALAVVTLSDEAMALSSESWQALTAAVLNSDLARIFRLLPVRPAQRLQPLFSLTRSEKHQLLGLIVPQTNANRAANKLEEPRFTPFGGAFVLLGILQGLPLAQLAEDWPEPAIGDKQAVIRLLLLAQCMGGASAGRVFRDPVLRDLAGVPPGLTAIETKSWLESIQPAQILKAQQQYINWRLADSASHRVVVQHCPFAHRSLAIVTEPGRGCWLWLRGYQTRRIQPLQRAIARMLPDGIDCRLQLDKRHPSQQHDLNYLRLPAILLSSNHTRWLLTGIAQGMLRDFAWRLPGFAHSSLSHLSNNFLDVTAKLEIEPERWLVRMGRPPLNVVLSMTGMPRQHYRLGWLDGQRIELYQGD